LRRFSLFLFFVTTLFTGTAQLPVDSLHAIDKRPLADSGRAINSITPVTSIQFVQLALKYHPYFGFKSAVIAKPVSTIRQAAGKERLFYLLLFLLIIFGILRQLFPKYFGDLFRLFFRTTLKQKQIREQLLQTPLPSLALNGFFIISASLYITFLLQHYKLITAADFWKIFLYAGIGLSIIYFVKFVGIKFSGWLFGMQEASSAYVFIVFIVNKMIGIFLYPFLLLLAFSAGNAYTAGLVLSWCMLAGLFSYRILLSYAATRKQIKVNPFHFFLYLLAFEIAPLLLIYKGLLLYFS
jgi:Domain of unknown function (DUF4271)